MKPFNVLDRSLDIHKNYLLEASAGTGKTFSIENIVVRLLIEREPIALEKILIVTFTKAAVRDLKFRIRNNIEQALDFLQSRNPAMPDYLSGICEKGEESVLTVISKLKQALLAYDQSQIFTIHSFCSRMLNEHVIEGDLRVDSMKEDESLASDVYKNVIRDYIRTEIREDKFSPAQLDIVLNDLNHSSEKLESTLTDLVKKNLDVGNSEAYDVLLKRFNCVMKQIKTDENISPASFYNDFCRFAPCYKNLLNRKKAIKPELLVPIKRFSQLFEKEQWGKEDLDWLISNQLSCLKEISADNQTTTGLRSSESQLFTNLCQQLKKQLRPFVSSISVLVRMAGECKKLIQTRFNNEEKFDYDDILRTMQSALENKAFVDLIRAKYQAALIDEFQDTDPLQWSIFQKLFHGYGYLYLVGDPKQSIYAFRQADIYTYLQAAEAIGAGNTASLNTNFRSESQLVKALNILFANASERGLLELPRIRKNIAYHNVNASKADSEWNFLSNRGAIHFLLADESEKKKFSLEDLEQKKIFPFLAQEISNLHKLEGISFNECAVLVTDRYQGQRVAECLKQWNIPCSKQVKSSGDNQSTALSALREVLNAAAHPKHESSLKLALGGSLIQWNHDKIRNLDGLHSLASVILRFQKLQHLLEEKGYAAFLEAFMGESWHDDGMSITERLLRQDGGNDLLNDIRMITNDIQAYECSHRLSTECLIDYLDRYIDLHHDNDQMNSQSCSESDGVNILTMHSSKGLEFTIVFTLGLIKRKTYDDEVMSVFRDGSCKIAPVIDTESEEYRLHCREVDAEKMRLLYVAMTRAKRRLYCPAVFSSYPKGLKRSNSSAMELFIEKLGLPQSDLFSFKAYLDGINANIKYTVLSDELIPDRLQSWSSKAVLTPPRSVHVPGKRRTIHSFTSLSATLSRSSVPNDGRTSPPSDFQSLVRTPHTLPSGSETGNVIHRLLETVSLSEALSAKSPLDFLSFVNAAIANTDFTGWESAICEILYHTLKTPFLAGSCMCDVDPDRIFRETEFLYQTSGIDEDKFLKGYLDLFFEHRGKYYLLDWKSNWLGSRYEDYNSTNMKNAIEENQYTLQAKIYRDAVRKYLRLVDKRPFADIFGGTYYIFVRGLNLENGAKYGVYQIKDEEDD